MHSSQLLIHRMIWLWRTVIHAVWQHFTLSWFSTFKCIHESFSCNSLFGPMLPIKEILAMYVRTVRDFYKNTSCEPIQLSAQMDWIVLFKVCIVTADSIRSLDLSTQEQLIKVMTTLSKQCFNRTLEESKG